MEKCKFYNGVETVTPTSTKIKCAKMDGGGRVFENKDPEGKMLSSCCWNAGRDCPLLWEQEQQTMSGEIEVKAAGEVSVERQEKAVHLTQRIITNGNLAASCIVEMGRDLKEVRDERLFSELGYESFEEYCEKKCGIGARHGYNFIQVFERFGEEKLAQMQGFGITKLLEIAKLDDEELDDLMKKNNVAELSVRQLKEEVEEYRNRYEQLTLMYEAEKSKKEDTKEMDELRARLDILEKQKSKAERELELFKDSSKNNDKRTAETIESLRDTIRAFREENSKLKVDLDKIKSLPAPKAEVSEEDMEKIKKAAEKGIEEKYSAEIEKLKAENAALQSVSNQPAPAPAGNDAEKVKFYLGEIQRAFNAAAVLVNGMNPDEQREIKEKMNAVIRRIGEALA